MTDSALALRRQTRDRLLSGVHPGLPSKVRAVPFGNESRWRSAYGITEAQVEIVACLCAAAFCGKTECTVREIEEKVSHRAQSLMRELERKCWVVLAGKRGQEQCWRATPRAFERLNIRDWAVAS